MVPGVNGATVGKTSLTCNQFDMCLYWEKSLKICFTIWPISIKLYKSPLCVKGIQVCSNKWPNRFQRGDEGWAIMSKYRYFEMHCQKISYRNTFFKYRYISPKNAWAWKFSKLKCKCKKLWPHLQSCQLK
jgi:hypothetical protein